MDKKKECRLSMRLPQDLYDEIDETVDFVKKKTKIQVTKTNVITSAISEGLKVLRAQIDNDK